jgi:maleate isomerase
MSLSPEKGTGNLTEQSVRELETKLDGVLDRLLLESRGSRVTLRVDDPGRGWGVDFVCAEAVHPGVKSLKGDGSIDQRAAATVKWMEANRRNLVQPDLTGSPDPAPPAALMSSYAAKAQMLAPLFDTTGQLQGWISVHYLEKHDFSDADIGALDGAAAKVRQLTGIGA